ncbi:hypothetical protein VSS95_28220, partial [Pseudomonas syringae pv. tagetis]
VFVLFCGFFVCLCFGFCCVWFGGGLGWFGGGVVGGCVVVCFGGCGGCVFLCGVVCCCLLGVLGLFGGDFCWVLVGFGWLGLVVWFCGVGVSRLDVGRVAWVWCVIFESRCCVN